MELEYTNVKLNTNTNSNVLEYEYKMNVSYSDILWMFTRSEDNVN
jgi:hypothetical protein